jgi:DNA (cytosine-5)-methyltransferase 1
LTTAATHGPPWSASKKRRQEDRLAGTVYEDEVPGLTTSKTYAVAIPAEPEGVDLLNQTTTGAVSATLRRDGEGASGASGAVIVPDLAVRRLTPRECERLMGWPDDWTRYAADGSEVADSSRYRMCGNGVASPVAEWIGRCIVAAEQELEA